MTRATTVQRDATKRWIAEVGLTDAKLGDVLARLQSDMPFGANTWIPDASTVFRWQRALRATREPRSGETLPPPRGRQRAVRATVSAATTTARARLVQRLPENAARELYVERIASLKDAATELREHLVNTPHLTPALQREYKTQMTWTQTFERGERGRRGTFAMDGVHRRYEELRVLVSLLSSAVNTRDGEHMMLVSRSTSVTAVARRQLARVSRMPLASSQRDDLMTMTAEVTVERPVFGDAIATTVVPQAGSIVRYSEDKKARNDAAIRALLVEPVLSSRLSARHTARLWQKHFRGLTTPEEALMLPQIPDFLLSDARNRYHNIRDDTIGRWFRRVTRLRAASPITTRSAPVDALIHRKGTAVRREKRKLTPEIATAIRRQFLREDETASPDSNASALLSVHNVNATMIADWLGEQLHTHLSPRTVQRYVAREIADADKLMARGGSEAADFLRPRLIRQARYPNHWWIMDHSFFSGELVDTRHPEWHKQLSEFEFNTAFARLTHSIGQTAARRRVHKLSMTLIVDACTRRKLALRVWEGTPSTSQTLIALHDAVVRFGVPEHLYTDNGSDFKSRRMLSSLQDLGVQSVHSQPYCPQGRGTVERDFRTIKEKILPIMVGYRGHADVAAPAVEELDDHATFEATLWDRVNKVMNHTKHSETGEIPAEHYDRCVGARVLQQPSPEALIGLLCERRDAVRESIGIKVFGGRYSGVGLLGIPEKARVVVHGDPYRPQLAHVSTYADDGTLRYRGPVERYGAGGAEAPQHDVFLALQQGWAADTARASHARRDANEKRTRQRRQLDAGDRMAHDLSEAVQSRVLLLAAGESASEPLTASTPEHVETPSLRAAQHASLGVAAIPALKDKAVTPPDGRPPHAPQHGVQGLARERVASSSARHPGKTKIRSLWDD